MNLARDIRGKKKGVLRDLKRKKENQGNYGLLLNEARALVRHDMEEAEVLNAIFTSVFSSKTCLLKFESPETKGKVWSKEDLSLLEEDQVGK